MKEALGSSLAWAFALACGSGGLATEPQAVHATYTVAIENMQFTPEELTVHPGDRIVWVNKDLFPHTVTATQKAFDSQGIAANASWVYVAKSPGVYPYSCIFHPSMKGKVTVR
jgi:plastocyanin